MRRRMSIIFAVLLLAVLALPAAAQRDRLGIAGRPAPAWDLEWLNLPQDTPRLAVEDFRGKVLYVFCFQSWCPGCHSHGFPTLQEVEQHYRGNGDVHFVAIQTVFEGFGTNTSHRALTEVQGYDLEIPTAHDEGERNAVSPFMRAYRTGGTPWTILIGPDGKVVWNGFQLEPEQAIELIDRLLPKGGDDASSISENVTGR